MPKLIMEWIPQERRKIGRPRKTWMEGVQADMTTRNLETVQWRNKEEWRLVSGRRRQLLQNWIDRTCLYFWLGYNLFIASKFTSINVIMICYVIILDTVIFNVFVHTYDDILYPKYLLCIYVLHQDGPCRPKHAGEMIITKQIFIYEYLQLVAINTV